MRLRVQALYDLGWIHRFVLGWGKEYPGLSLWCSFL